MLTPQQEADQLLKHWQLLWPLPAAERIKLIDEITKDYRYEHELRVVTHEMESMQ